VNVELIAGDQVDIQVAAKGGGSENKSKFVMLNPSDSLVDWVLKTVPTMGAGWCPPGMLGIGVGGTAEKAMLMAKEALMEDIDMYELLQRGPQSKLEELRIELYEKVNALGYWRSRAGWFDDCAGREDQHLPDSRRFQACGHDSQLCGNPSRAFLAGRQWPSRAGTSTAVGLA
jgi:fumarate hydratase class I